MISIKLLLVIIVLTLVLISFFKSVKSNEKTIQELIKECDSICSEIEKIDLDNPVYDKNAIDKHSDLTREKDILMDKLINHGHFYEYVPNRK